LEKVDRWVWKDDKFQEFFVNSAYGILRGVHEGDGSRMYICFGGLNLRPQVRLPLGGCWKIRLSLRLIYLDAGLRSEVFYAAFVGLKRKR